MIGGVYPSKLKYDSQPHLHRSHEESHTVEPEFFAARSGQVLTQMAFVWPLVSVVSMTTKHSS